jgi:hypothetical protein
MEPSIFVAPNATSHELAAIVATRESDTIFFIRRKIKKYVHLAQIYNIHKKLTID